MQAFCKRNFFELQSGLKDILSMPMSLKNSGIFHLYLLSGFYA
jgi:hypothetical protein